MKNYTENQCAKIFDFLKKQMEQLTKSGTFKREVHLQPGQPAPPKGQPMPENPEYRSLYGFYWCFQDRLFELEAKDTAERQARAQARAKARAQARLAADAQEEGSDDQPERKPGYEVIRKPMDFRRDHMKVKGLLSAMGKQIIQREELFPLYNIRQKRQVEEKKLLRLTLDKERVDEI